MASAWCSAASRWSWISDRLVRHVRQLSYTDVATLQRRLRLIPPLGRGIPMQVSKVLVVDGDRDSRDALVTCLKFIGVEAHGAEDAAAARCWLTTGSPDVVVISDELTDGV